MTKVAQLSKSLIMGGAETMAVQIANLLNYNKIESHLIIACDRKDEPLREKIDTGVKSYVVGQKNRIDFVALFKVIRYIKKNKIDVLHVHFPWSSWLANWVKRICKIKLINHCHHGGIINWGEVELKEFSKEMKFSDVLISMTPRQTKLLRELTINNTKVVELKNFATNEILEPKFSKTNVLCILGRVENPKGHHFLLEAFKMVSEKRSDVELKIIGPYYPQRDYHKHMVEFISENKLDDRVEFVGKCLDINKILQNAKCGIITSEYEAGPIVAIEYAHVGLPIISTKVGFIPDIVRNRENGLVVDYDNAETLSEMILSVCEMDENQYIEMATSFQDDIIERFGKESYYNVLIHQVYSIKK